jgi:hypothetical protein
MYMYISNLYNNSDLTKINKIYIVMYLELITKSYKNIHSNGIILTKDGKNIPSDNVILSEYSDINLFNKACEIFKKYTTIDLTSTNIINDYLIIDIQNIRIYINKIQLDYYPDNPALNKNVVYNSLIDIIKNKDKYTSEFIQILNKIQQFANNFNKMQIIKPINLEKSFIKLLLCGHVYSEGPRQLMRNITLSRHGWDNIIILIKNDIEPNVPQKIIKSDNINEYNIVIVELEDTKKPFVLNVNNINIYSSSNLFKVFLYVYVTDLNLFSYNIDNFVIDDH